MEMDTSKMAPYICEHCNEQCDLDMELYRYDKINTIILCSKCVHVLFDTFEAMKIYKIEGQ
jgi:hypothetical protein